jgi:predicted glycoside hydrolase/deacetylase ChbG (UPF0249 family)
MTYPRLIVNGDDFGRTEGLTRGVVEAHERGILTSTSLVASSLHFDLAVSLAKQHPDLGVGVHLVIDEYDPLSSPGSINSLLTPGGSFHARHVALWKILVGQISPDECLREWEAQIERVVDAGLKPTHLDGHGHCHASPTLAGLVADLAKRFGIGAVRIPSEQFWRRGEAGKFEPRRHLEKALLNTACMRPRTHWKGRLQSPDHFFGFMDAGRFSPAALDGVARSLIPGVSELMAHPALDNEDPPYGLAYDWRADFDALMAYGRAEFEQRFGLELVSFRSAWLRP